MSSGNFSKCFSALISGGRRMKQENRKSGTVQRSPVVRYDVSRFIGSHFFFVPFIPKAASISVLVISLIHLSRSLLLLAMSNILSIGGIFQDADWIKTDDAIKVGLVFASVSIIISMLHILRHLKNYSMPEVQLYVIRILLTCPVYAVTSSIALTLGKNGIYAEVLRDVYEAVVVYSFMHLMLEYSGGETDCVYLMENEPRLRLPCPLCCMKPRARTLRLLRFCQRGVIQFILTQPTVAVVSLILLITGQYKAPAWQILQTIIYNISYAWALYCLYVFYLAIKQNIKNFRPIAKFASVKSIIFATYYQSLFLKLMLADIDHAILWNDLLLCVEMVIFSTALVFAFPVSDFQGGVPDRRVLENVKDVFTLKDILHDVYHNFTSTYDDYALQRSESETPANAGSIMKVRNRLSARAPSVQHMLPNSLHSGGSSHSTGDSFCAVNSPATNTSEYSQEYLESGQLNGKLGSVAQQMSERYRGRSKRLAFNALLRGSQPIKATLRPARKYHHQNQYDQSDSGHDEFGAERKDNDENSPLNPLLTSGETEDMVEIVFDNGNNHHHNSTKGAGSANGVNSNNSSVHSVTSLNTASNTDSAKSTSAKNSAKENAITTSSNTAYNSATTSTTNNNATSGSTSTLGRLTLSLKPHRSPTTTPGTSSNNLIAWPKFTNSADTKGSSDKLSSTNTSLHDNTNNTSEVANIELMQHSPKDTGNNQPSIDSSHHDTASILTSNVTTSDTDGSLCQTTAAVTSIPHGISAEDNDAEWGEFL